MTKKFDGDPVAYTHLGFAGVVPCWIRFSDENEPEGPHNPTHLRPAWWWLAAAMRWQAFAQEAIGRWLRRRAPYTLPVFTILRLD